MRSNDENSDPVSLGEYRNNNVEALFSGLWRTKEIVDSNDFGDNQLRLNTDMTIEFIYKENFNNPANLKSKDECLFTGNANETLAACYTKMNTQGRSRW